MQIIWSQEAAERLSNSHTVLELETFEVKGESITTYCVVPAEKIIGELSQLDTNKNLHSEFLKAFKKKDYKFCEDCAELLIGKFGGELDTFYEEILKRIR
jgi:hypothetical protein